MRPYEIMVILDAGLEEDVIRTTLDRAAQVISQAGGTVGRIDRWGRRRFAYEVKHQSEGYYALMEINAQPPAIAEVDRMLGLADEVVRHKVVRLPDKVAGRPRRPAGAETAPAADTSANGA